MKKRNREPRVFLDHFDQLEGGLNGDRRSWLHDLRRAGVRRYRELGFPTRKNEEWKYTNVSALARQPFRWAGALGLPALDPGRLANAHIPDLQGPRLVFLNGRFVEALSSPAASVEGVTIGSLAAELKSSPQRVRAHLARDVSTKEDPFASLNTGFIGDGAYVHVGPRRTVSEPIHLLFVTTTGGETLVDHPRSLVVLDDDATASVVEHYLSLEEGEPVYFTNAVTEAVLAPNARLEWLKLQQESRKAFHIANTNVRQDRDSVFTHHSISLGGALTRNDINTKLDAPGVECSLYGFYLADGDQLVDHHTLVEHAQPHGNSWELYKGVLDGRAQGVFNGKIFVHQEAQKTDAKQSNRNLLLSEHAVINTKPQLQIYADDVKCTHGATVGRLDRDALHYMRCRGIGAAEARRILTRAFAGEVLREIGDGVLRAYVERLVEKRMSECEGLAGRRPRGVSTVASGT